MEHRGFDWNQARAAVAAAEAGTLSGAARALGLAQPTVGRQVAALETALGVTLFERTGRALLLTGAGAELMPHLAAMAAAADRARLVAAGRVEAVAGEVAITATDAVAAYVLPPILAALADKAPGVTVEVVASNAVSDLTRREADIAIRRVRPTESGLIARKLRTSRGRLYASRVFLDRFGPIDGPEALKDAPIIGPERPERLIEMLRAAGAPVERAQVRYLSESGVAMWRMARAGLGVTVMLEEVAEGADDMVVVWPDMAPFEAPFWLVTHRELRQTRRIRVVWDHLVEALSSGPG